MSRHMKLLNTVLSICSKEKSKNQAVEAHAKIVNNNPGIRFIEEFERIDHVVKQHRANKSELDVTNITNGKVSVDSNGFINGKNLIDNFLGNSAGGFIAQIVGEDLSFEKDEDFSDAFFTTI